MQTRVNWLVRQLGDAPGQLRIDGLLSGTRTSTSEMLSTLREDSARLIDPQKRDFRAFRVTAISQIGTKRGTGRGSFIDSVLSAVDGFYEIVVQALRPWTPKAPQLPKSGKSAAEDAGIYITPPPADLTEPIGSDSSPEQTESSEEVQADADGVGTPQAAVGPEAEMIIWDRANERLAREREHAPTERPHGPSPVG